MAGHTARLKDLGIELPEASAPAANDVPYVEAGGLLYVSGQISMDAEGALITGKLGADLDTPAGAEAAFDAGGSVTND